MGARGECHVTRRCDAATLRHFLLAVNHLTCRPNEKMVISPTHSLRQIVMVSEKFKKLGTTFVVLGNVYLVLALTYFLSNQSIFMWIHIIAGVSCMRNGYTMRKMAKQ